MKSTGFAIACLVFVAAPACADGPVFADSDRVVAAQAASSSPVDWTGFYVGLSLLNGTLGRGTQDFGTQGLGAQAGYLHDLGTFVIGGELQYSSADLDDVPGISISSTRMKLIGGFDAGRVLPYAFVGLSDIKIDEGTSVSDTGSSYGLGARFALGAEGRFVAGLEYLVESKDSFGGGPVDVDNKEFTLRLDYRF